jgi:hypothetical protein
MHPRRHATDLPSVSKPTLNAERKKTPALVRSARVARRKPPSTRTSITEPPLNIPLHTPIPQIVNNTIREVRLPPTRRSMQTPPDIAIQSSGIVHRAERLGLDALIDCDGMMI